MPMSRTHIYEVRVRWTGNRSTGTSDYRDYGRDHLIEAGTKPAIEASSDPAFRGDVHRYNPEELLVASVSSCHMLWYLHLCAAAGVNVVGYRNDPLGTMVEDRQRPHDRCRASSADCAVRRGRSRTSDHLARRSPSRVLHRQLGEIPDRVRTDDHHRGGPLIQLIRGWVTSTLSCNFRGRRLRVMEIDDRAKSGEACRRHSWLAGQIIGLRQLTVAGYSGRGRHGSGVEMPWSRRIFYEAIAFSTGDGHLSRGMSAIQVVVGSARARVVGFAACRPAELPDESPVHPASSARRVRQRIGHA